MIIFFKLNKLTRMADKTNKSHFTQKQTEKDDKPSPEELKLRKLYDIVQKLQTAVEHKESNYERISHKEQTKQNVNLKSNYSNPTTSRIKEDRSDRDFINNFLIISTFLPYHTIINPLYKILSAISYTFCFFMPYTPNHFKVNIFYIFILRKLES